MKRRMFALLLAVTLILLCGCRQAPTPAEPVDTTLFASVVERLNNTVTVLPLSDDNRVGGDTTISFTVSEDNPVILGDVVQITYDGQITAGNPAQINATACVKLNEPVSAPYPGDWLDKSIAQSMGDSNGSDFAFIITAIYDDCFFAKTLPPTYVYKINTTEGNQWCIGDYVFVDYCNGYYDTKSRAEADLVSIKELVLDPNLIITEDGSNPETDYTVAKPVIYLYPETEADVDVALTLDGELTCTYPAYGDGWHVTAAPDGTLTDERGQTYNYLYWEGETNAAFDMSRGFCVKGEDTAAFLETALADLGLTRREANEFIVYWLPLMEQNPYNLIAFQTDAYTDAATLDISPAPDTLIRVFMTFKGVDTFVEIDPQTLSAPARVGFTAVEWGGTEIE